MSVLDVAAKEHRILNRQEDFRAEILKEHITPREYLYLDLIKRQIQLRTIHLKDRRFQLYDAVVDYSDRGGATVREDLAEILEQGLIIVEGEKKTRIYYLSDRGRKIMGVLSEKAASFVASFRGSVEGLGLMDRIEDYTRKHLLPQSLVDNTLLVDVSALESVDPGLADNLITFPAALLENKQTLLDSFSFFYQQNNPLVDLDAGWSKAGPLVGVFNLGKERRKTLSALDERDLGRVVEFEAVVVSISSRGYKPTEAVFRCVSCRSKVSVSQSREARLSDSLCQPVRCTECGKNEFQYLPEESRHTTFHILRVQEPQDLTNYNPKECILWIEGNRTRDLDGGDRVLVCGVKHLLPPKKKSTVYSFFIDVLHIEKTNKMNEEVSEEDLERFREIKSKKSVVDYLAEHMAPNIEGHEEIKRALVLQNFGGVLYRNGEQKIKRGDIHVLVLGDPGVAKSALAEAALLFNPRGYKASGTASTGVGLTVAAEKDEQTGQWMLRAGALPRANGGVLWIDEFDKMSKEDRGKMHEGMENQEINANRAGLSARFKTEAGILATANPKHTKFDSFRPIKEQFDIPPALLSRFDLIFPIVDCPDAGRDGLIAARILGNLGSSGSEGVLDREVVKKYVSYARQNFNPVVGEDVARLLSKFYVNIRQDSKEGLSATARQLEGMIRLCEASARARHSNHVTVADFRLAKRLFMCYIRAVATNPNTGDIDISRVFGDAVGTRNEVFAVEALLGGDLRDDKGVVTWTLLVSGASDVGIGEARLGEILDELRSRGSVVEVRPGCFVLN